MPRLPLVIAASAISVLGLVVIGITGGMNALLGPSLAAAVAGIYVLVGR